MGYGRKSLKTMGDASEFQEVFKKFLDHLIQEKSRFRRESRQQRKKRLRKLRDRRKNASLSADDRRTLDGLEGSAVYSNACSTVFRAKTPGKKGANIPEIKQQYVAKQVYEWLYPDKNDSILFLDNEIETNPRSARSPRWLEMRLRRFEREYIVPGKLDLFQLIESEFSTFKASEVARLHPELYQGFPSLGTPRSNIQTLANMRQITKSEEKVPRSICKDSAARTRLRCRASTRHARATRTGRTASPVTAARVGL